MIRRYGFITFCAGALVASVLAPAAKAQLWTWTSPWKPKSCLLACEGLAGRLPAAGFHVPKMRSATCCPRKQATGQIRYAGKCLRSRTHAMP